MDRAKAEALLVEAHRRLALRSASADPKGDERALYLDTPPFEEWCQYIDIALRGGGVVPFSAANWSTEQRQLNRDRTGRDVILKGRQQTVSTFELARDLWTPLKYPGTHTLIVTQDDETARKFHAVLTLMIRGLERANRLPPVDTDRVGEIVFRATGSSLRVALAGATEHVAQKVGRGGAVFRLHGTEVAFWRAAGTTLGGALEAVPDAGEVVLESTANGAAGEFYQRFTSAAVGDESGYRAHFLPWLIHDEYRRDPGEGFDPDPRDEHERAMRELGADDAQIAWWRAKLAQTGDIERALQEYPYDARVAFRSSGGDYIDAATCDWLATQTRDPIRILEVKTASGPITVRIYEEPAQGERYVIGADVAEGIGKDAHAADCASYSTGLTVATAHSDTIEPYDFGLALNEIGLLFNTALVAPERNKDGATVIAALLRSGYPNIYQHEDERLGWPTNPATRPPLFDEQAHAWRDRTLPTPDARVAAEARTLTRGPDGKPAARGKGSKGGARDDAFVARAITTQVRQRTNSVGGGVTTGGTRAASQIKQAVAGGSWRGKGGGGWKHGGGP